MIRKILVSAFVMATSAFAADLTKIPFNDASGKSTSLADYKGKVVLIVNVASKCGLTPQYEGLQALQKQYEEKGFTILAFPCNDFKGQEPGTIAEIQEFCKTKYDVTFPIMDKISVIGDEQHPLYKALTGERGAFPGDVKWNFGKFLIGRNGKPIARFEPKTVPSSPEISEAIEKALEKKS